MVGKKYHLFGQGLLGAGIATLYFAIFAAANFYQLIEFVPAFALMALITLVAGVVAVRCQSVLVAVLGINTVFVLLFAGSGFLFRRAGTQTPAPA